MRPWLLAIAALVVCPAAAQTMSVRQQTDIEIPDAIAPSLQEYQACLLSELNSQGKTVPTVEELPTDRSIIEACSKVREAKIESAMDAMEEAGWIDEAETARRTNSAFAAIDELLRYFLIDLYQKQFGSLPQAMRGDAQ